MKNKFVAIFVVVVVSVSVSFVFIFVSKIWMNFCNIMIKLLKTCKKDYHTKLYQWPYFKRFPKRTILYKKRSKSYNNHFSIKTDHTIICSANCCLFNNNHNYGTHLIFLTINVVYTNTYSYKNIMIVVAVKIVIIMN